MSRRVGMSDDEWAAFKDNYASDQRLGVREYIAPPKVLRRHHCFGEKTRQAAFDAAVEMKRLWGRA